MSCRGVVDDLTRTAHKFDRFKLHGHRLHRGSGRNASVPAARAQPGTKITLSRLQFQRFFPTLKRWKLLHKKRFRNCKFTEILLRAPCESLSWWCSGSASDSWSKGRWFHSRPGRYQLGQLSLPSIRVGKSSTSLHGWLGIDGTRSLVSGGR